MEPRWLLDEIMGAWTRAGRRSGAPAYDRAFYEGQVSGSLSSAREVVPLVMELVRPKSVVDVGCGVGPWLATFREHGVDDMMGVDGGYVDPAQLLIPRDRFRAHDLAQPLALGRRFNLAVSVEVAEHLPEEAADRFVDSLTTLAPAVLFSAAIPFQGGNQHVNEQWPEYWAARFENRGYRVIDCLRRHIWNSDRVEWWYAQNLLLYVHHDLLAGNPALEAEAARTGRSQLALVHPRKYLSLQRPAPRGVPDAVYAIARRLPGPLVPAARSLAAFLAKARGAAGGGDRVEA
jgi:hypothetical protein